MTEQEASHTIPLAAGDHSDYIVYVDESGDHSLISITRSLYCLSAYFVKLRMRLK